MKNEESRADSAITYAEASLEMEGLHLDGDSKQWCRKLLLGEISFEEYLNYAKQKAGVTAA